MSLLDETLHNATAPLNSSAISFAIQSIHEDKPMLEFHYTPQNFGKNGVQKVDANTVYRLASTSKLFPVLAVLKTEGMDLNDPITKYLPQLRNLKKESRQQNQMWVVDWDDITLGALSSHLGAPADLVLDLSTDPDTDWTEIGFPKLDRSVELNCSLKGDPPCPEHVFWDLFGQRPPVYAPFTEPVYSNIAFALLSWAVETVTNRTFSDYVRETIWEPAGMQHTFASKPDDSLGAIPVDDTWWTATVGLEKAAGDYYSSISDMLAFGISILKNEQLSPVGTRRWMKPVTPTSASNVLLGTPWEIYRFTNETKDGRLIELYTKMGNIFDYNSNFVLIPDYDVVVQVLTAGPETSGFTVLGITTAVIKALLPALEEAGKEETRKSHAGTYSDAASNSSITLSLDDENPGIKVSNWTVRGVNVFDSFSAIDRAFLKGTAKDALAQAQDQQQESVRMRMYPTGLETENQSSWRGVSTFGTAEQLAAVDKSFIWPMGTCLTWAQMDRIQYGLQSQDHFVFTLEGDESGKEAVSVELPAYKVTLRKETPVIDPDSSESQYPMNGF
ncbi:beta-lactamase/transpeptidase-like protein [Pestalotiopsis sp. NC0098]|nr:beta-lactamase/transpeptidase-like protein [Pestalotiopsis sp. NC0098]